MPDIDVLLTGPLAAEPLARLERSFRVHRAFEAADPEALIARLAPEIRAIARSGPSRVDATLIGRLPALEIVASFGVGYDQVDTTAAAARGIIVTNTPDVLTEEVADTAFGLLLMTVRELPQAERFLRSGRWRREGDYPLTEGTLRDRTVGIVGLGRIGLAIARRLDASQVPVVYHNRKPRPDVPYRYYADLRAMATAVDTLMIVLPGGSGTKNLIDASVLEALGPRGIVINIGRGSVIDEPALIAALRGRRIAAAGLDVFASEPNVPDELLVLPSAVLLPHVGSASRFTREAMDALVVDNLVTWFAEGRALTPVPETPQRRGL